MKQLKRHSPGSPGYFTYSKENVSLRVPVPDFLCTATTALDASLGDRGAANSVVPVGCVTWIVRTVNCIRRLEL